jgi:uncharacterized protein YfaT (DUF1175 family)
MKAFIIAVILMGCVAGFTSCSVESGVVQTRPADVIYVRPVSPGPGYVWMGGNWVYRGGNYNWHEGRWHRVRAGRSWQDGRWEPAGNGWRWRRGYWR